MSRIPSWAKRARPLLLALLAAGAAPAGCVTDGESDRPPTLAISPATGVQGESIAFTVGVEGYDIGRCGAFLPDALTFVRAESGGLISVRDMAPVNASTLRASIAIDPHAGAGDYAVALRCREDLTFYSETPFSVRARGATQALAFSPPSLAAGVLNAELTVTAPSDFSLSEESYPVFGDGAYVTIREMAAAAPQTMRLLVDVSRDAPVGPIDAALVSGAKVARGSLEITERVEVAIESVVPDTVIRPALGEGAPREYQLEITGTTDQVGFVQPGADAGAGDATATIVTFHPLGIGGDTGVVVSGIAVTDIRVGSARKLSATVAVYENAPTGRMRLRVATGDRTAETSFWVEPAPGEPYLALRYPPGPVVRGGSGIDLIAEPVNFSLDDVTAVHFLEPGAAISKSFVSETSITLKADIDDDFAGDDLTLEVETTALDALGKSARAVLFVVDPSGGRAVLEPNRFVQGDSSEWVEVKLLGGAVFVPETANAAALERSGIRIRDRFVKTDTEMILQIDIAEDAPAGEAALSVFTGNETIEAPVWISPSGAVPAMELLPWVALVGRNTLEMEIRAERLAFVSGSARFKVDNPGVGIDKVLIDNDDPSRARLTLAVSPTARSGSSVIYASGNDQQASAAFRLLSLGAPYVDSVAPAEISRAPGGTTQTVTVSAQGIAFDAASVAQVMSGIGISARRVEVDPFDDHKAQFVLEIDESGPGGWFGVRLFGGLDSVVAPIHCSAGGDESLTVQIVPGAVSAGEGPVPLLGYLPAQAEVQGQGISLSTGLPGSYASAPEMLDIATASLFLDVAFGLEADAVPVFFETAKGAAVGWVAIENPAVHALSPGAVWSGILADGETALLEIAPGASPSLVYASAGWPDDLFADVSIESVADNRIDRTDQSDTGSIWLTTPETRMIAVSPIGDPAGRSSEVRVRPFGSGALGQAESFAIGAEAPEWSPDADPCDQAFFGAGVIDGALDVDRIRLLNPTGCSLAAVLLARRLSDQAWFTPDLWMELRDGDDVPVAGQRAVGWPDAGTPDPELFLDAGVEDRFVAIGAELGTAGAYLVNLRRARVISEISRDAAAPYIEILAEPGTALDAPLAASVLDAATGLPLGSFVFSGQIVGADGAVLLGEGADADIATDLPALIPATGPFAVRLAANGDREDAVQVGTSGNGSLGEGNPISAAGSMPVFFRPYGIDTDDNARDFVNSWVGTPGE